MKRTSLAALALSLLVLPLTLAAQDYTQYEVQRVSSLPGSTADIGMAMVEHNRLFHAEAPYSASVFYIVSGKYAGQFQWVMGPTTFTQIGDRPADPTHGFDWANRVLANAEAHQNEYWRQVDDLSYVPANMPEGPRPISVVRLFNVTDGQLFRKLQRQIMEVVEAAGSPNPRVMYQRWGASDDPWGWGVVTSYPSYAALDAPGFNFEAEFRALHGDAAWATFQEEIGQAVAGRDDAIRQLITGM